MPKPTPINYDALESALQWSSSGEPHENEAFLSRATGEVLFRSMGGDVGEEMLPEDIEDGTLFIVVPHKNDFDLGRRLVFAFVEESAPTLAGKVDSLFRLRGAYGKFKALLEREGLLDHWHGYENEATRAALEEWAVGNGCVVVRDA